MVETGALMRTSRIIVVGGTEWATIEEHAGELGLRSEPAPEPAAATSAPQAFSATWVDSGDGGAASGSASAPPSQPTTPAAVAYSAPASTPGPAPVPGGLAPLASNGKRLGGWLLDGLIFVVSAITLFLGWFIWAFIIFGKGQTPGKQLLGLRVVSADTGKVVSYGTMALRTLVYQLLLGSVTGGITTIVGGVMMLVDKEKRQALWDKIANTLVVDDPEGRTL